MKSPDAMPQPKQPGPKPLGELDFLRPLTSVDIATFAIREERLHVLLERDRGLIVGPRGSGEDDGGEQGRGSSRQLGTSKSHSV